MKIAYLCHESRHPYHDGYANSIGAERILAGFNKTSTNRLKQYWHSTKLIFTFPYKKYHYILTDGPNLIPVLIKKLSSNRIKLISTQGNNHLVDYFNGSFSKRFAKQFKYVTNQYDLIICTGEIQYNLAKKICEGNDKINIESSFNGVSEERHQKLSKVSYKSDSKKIISLSNQGTKYLNDMKGLDIMLQRFSELVEYYPELEYYHIGPFWDGLLEDLKKKFPSNRWDKIHFVGKQNELGKWFSDALCMFHLSRKDAFPFAVTEAFCAGIPVFIGKGVGLKQMYKKVDQKELFVVDTDDKEQTLENMKEFLNLVPNEKIKISNSFRFASNDYTSTKAVSNYKRIVNHFFQKTNR